MALVTCTSRLTMDLYLPAIPDLQRGLGLSVEQGDGGRVLVGLGLSQLLWGAALQRLGHAVASVMVGLTLASAALVIGCSRHTVGCPQRGRSP